MRLMASMFAAGAAFAWAEDGAKALFLRDASTGGELSLTEKKAPAPAVRKQAPAAPVVKPPPGLMYWVELVKADGALERVTEKRVFRSGEKIRLHFQTNRNGRIMIAQKQKNGEHRVLFPDPRVNNGDDRIAADVDTTIPGSSKAWFVFDDKPGQEVLLVHVMPDLPAGQAPNMNRAAGPAFPPLPSIGDGGGSKDILLQVDDNDMKPATYCVPVTTGGATPTMFAVEIALNHQ